MQLIAVDPAGLPAELAGGDVRYVGVSSDYPAMLARYGDPDTAMSYTTVYFALVTHGDWSTPSVYESYFEIGVDTDGDNIYEATVFNSDASLMFGGDPTDVFVSGVTIGGSWIYGVGSPWYAFWFNGVSPDVANTYAMGNNVMVLPVAASDLLLTGATTSFRFDVYSLSSLQFGELLPETAPYWYSYDVADPTYSFNDLEGLQGGPFTAHIWPTTGEVGIPMEYHLASASEPLPPVLLLYHHNSADATVGRAELVPVERATEMDAAMLLEADSTVPAAGGTVTLTAVIESLGPGPVEDPVVRTLLPAGLSLQSFHCPGAFTTRGITGGTEVECDLSGFNVPSGTAFFYDIIAGVAPGLDGSNLTVTSEIHATSGLMTDTGPGNEQVTLYLCVGGSVANCPDDDGVPMADEAEVPGFNGALRGDGNGDGVADNLQSAVTSLLDEASGCWWTLESSGAQNRGVSVGPVPNGVPSWMQYPCGFVSFETELAEGQSSATVRLYVRDGDPQMGGALKFDYERGVWRLVGAHALVDGASVITFTLTDGGPFDADRVVNGRISDPAGPAVLPAGIPLLGPWALALLAGLLGLAAAGRRRFGNR